LGQNLIVADKTWLIGMFRTTADKPTAESFRLTATQFDMSPLIIPLSFVPTLVLVAATPRVGRRSEQVGIMSLKLIG